MKNVKNQSQFFLGLTYTLVGTMLVLFTACNNSSKNNTQPQYIPPMQMLPISMTASPGCTTCMNPAQMAFMATTDSENVRGSLYLGMDFFADISRGFDLNDPKLPTKYVGATQVHGKLIIRNIDTDLCNAPPGEYEVRTAAPGMWQAGVTSSALSGFGPSALTLEARSMNGYMVILTMAQGIIYNPSISGTAQQVTNRLGGTLVVQSVNNQICRSLLGTANSLELF